MARFDGIKFYRLARWIAQIETLLGGLRSDDRMHDPILPDTRVSQIKRFTQYRRLVASCGFKYSVKSADRILALLNNPSSTFQMYERALYDLQIHVREEAEEINLWRIEYPQFFVKDGLGLKNKFRPAHKDAEEAGKCLAFDRNVAAVFHLMRVMEVGLRQLSETLKDPNLDPSHNPSWDAILKKCDAELLKPYDKRSDEWRTDNVFLSTATANLRAVKDAWRNTTLHVDRTYDGEEAREVWNAVRAFMRHLANKLGD